MALIICPECNKEISDKVKSCPHCGYPIAEDVSSAHEPLNVKVTSIINKRNKKMRKFALIGLIFTFSIACISVFIVYQNAQKASKVRIAILDAQKVRNEYIDNLNLISSTMLIGAGEAEQLCNLTARVWANTIFKKHSSETDKYTTVLIYSSVMFNPDFNTSLAILFDDNDTKGKITSIKQNQVVVSLIMKDLKNPTMEFERCYDNLNELFVLYIGFTDLAISPNGSLQVFNQNVGEKVDKFMGYYKTLITQIPEKR